MDIDKRIGAPKSLEEALQLQAKIMIPGQSTAELINMYDNWSTWDEFTAVTKYKGPEVVGDAVVKHLPVNRDVRVLDVAAGTGQVGEQLKAHGFNNIDALDPSVGMLNVARQKNVYRNYIQEFFPCEKPSVKTSSYDILVVAGGMGESHMNCDCLPEMVRCVKKGGLVVISVTEKYLTDVAEYNNRLEPRMKQLEMEGQWQILEKTITPNVYLTNNGLLFVLKVTKTEN